MKTHQLILIIGALLVLLGLTAVYVLHQTKEEVLVDIPTPSDQNKNDEPEPGPGNPDKTLRERESSYAEAVRIIEENPSRALELLTDLKGAALNGHEYEQTLFMIGRAKETLDPLGAIATYKELISADVPENNIVRASAVSRLGIVYADHLTEEVFNAIFSDELAHLRVARDGGDADVSASLEKLLEFGADTYPLAVIELRRANNALNAAADLTRKRFEYCASDMTLVADDGCTAPTDRVFTNEELVVYEATKKYVAERIAQAEADIARLKRNKDMWTLAPVLGEYANVLSKSASLGFVGKAAARAAHDEAFAFSSEYANREDRAVILLNYASFLGGTLWESTDEMHTRARDLLAAFYKDDWQEHLDLSWLQDSYEALTSEDTLSPQAERAYRLNIVGPLVLTALDARWTNFLTNDLGWNLEHPAIRALY